MKQDLLRIIDANLNRSREGLRVCEEISRFVLEDTKCWTTQRLGNCRASGGHGTSYAAKCWTTERLGNDNSLATQVLESHEVG